MLTGVPLATLLFAIVGVARLPWRVAEGGFTHLALAQEAIAALSAMGLFVALTRARIQTRDPIFVTLILIIVVELASGVMASNGWAAVRASSVVLCGVAAFMTARVVGCRGRTVPLLLVALIAGGVLLEALGVMRGASRFSHAPGGFLGERNAAAQLLVIAIPLLVSLAWKHESQRTRAIARVVLAMSAAAITLCRTRSAWLAMLVLVAFGVHALLRLLSQTPTRRDAQRVALVIGPLVIGVLVALTVPTALRWSSSHPYRETALHLVDSSTPSASGRREQYLTTLRMAWAHPLLGVGPGNWSGQYLAFARPQDPTLSAAMWPVNRLPSSDVFGFVAERGLLGVALGLALALQLLHGKDEQRFLRRATLAALCVVSTFDAVLQLAPAMMLAAWVLGNVSPMTDSRDTECAPKRERWNRGLGVAFGSALAVAAALAFVRVESFRAMMRARDLEAMERAVALDRGDIARTLFTANVAVQARRCDRALPLLKAAAERAVETAAGRELRERCGR